MQRESFKSSLGHKFSGRSDPTNVLTRFFTSAPARQVWATGKPVWCFRAPRHAAHGADVGAFSMPACLKHAASHAIGAQGMDATPEARRVPLLLAGWCGPRSASRARRSTACDTPAPRSARLWPNFEPALATRPRTWRCATSMWRRTVTPSSPSACRGWPPARTGAVHTHLAASYS